MGTLKNVLFSTVFFFLAMAAFAQGKISGTVTDADLGSSLPGATVSVKNTQITATTDQDGKFTLDSETNQGEILITYVGFNSRTIPFTINNGVANLGNISISVQENALEEIVIKSGVADIAKDRKTPVAVSTIKFSEIRDKLGNREFPEILNNTPSVYATKSGGGFGDSRINIRGFSQENIAVLINGVPVNDMENSRVFWSNWAGLSDVTSAMQVQRGLGSSKLAISSVGGTINVLTRTADLKEGGTISVNTGNDSYFKSLASYSTGKMKNGLSASILLSETTGDGYVDGTKFAGGNYFIGIGYSPNDKHDFQFTITGAPQWHNQRSAAPTIAQYLKYGDGTHPNIKYNSDWGYLDGEEYSFRTNYYHKPVASINWDWKINETTKLATVIYGSWGRGGGSNGAGAIRGNRFFADNLRTANGIINVDLIKAYNSGETVTINGTQQTRAMVDGTYQSSSATGNNATNGITQISSINSHNWYGGVVDLNKKIGKNFILDFGIDMRAYRGIHYQSIVDLLGTDNYIDNFDVNNPNRVLNGEYNARPSLNPFFNADHQQKINYNNDGLVNWYGAFTQFEYSTDKLTAFIQGAVSSQGFRRDDYFKYLETDPLYSTDYENIIGGNVKTGMNYNINQNHNVFFNTGYYSKQPFFNAVYPNNASVLNENLTNEKIFGIELGYGYRSAKFNANVNLYRTSWKDRFIRLTTNIDNDLNPATPTIPGAAFLQGVEEIHMGAEVDFTYKPIPQLAINGMVSIGNWKYGSNVTANYQDDNNVVITNPATDEPFSETLYLDGVKVGDAAQTTASIGATYEVIRGLKIDANYRQAENLFASIDPVNFRTEAANALGSLELPGYGLVDVGAGYKLFIGKQKTSSLNFRLNVDNLMDKRYIAESRTNQFAATETEFNGNTGNGAGLNAATNPLYSSYADYQARGIYDSLDIRNQVYFGFGRTWNFSIRYDF